MIKVYLSCFFITLILSLLFVPLAIFLSKEFNIYDRPNKRKVHTRPIPRWGGLGIYFTCVVCLIAVYYIFPHFQNLLSGELNYTSKLIGSLSLKKQLMGIFAGGSLILLLGMIDDRKPVRALTKLLVQIIVAYCVMDFGVRIFGLTLPIGNRYYQFPILVSQIVTVLWLVGFMNTINLADGLDGLAAGIVMIASGTFFIVSVLQKTQINDLLVAKQLQLSGVLSMTLCGASLGFILFNFHPAKVFMGDSGALLLGFLLGSISIIGTLKATAVISLFIPVIIVALPIFDVILSIYRRLRMGINVGKPDKEHIHHRLLKWGLSHREVVLSIYVITLILSIFAITLTALRG